jgi:subtilisin family serine protease
MKSLLFPFRAAFLRLACIPVIVLLIGHAATAAVKPIQIEGKPAHPTRLLARYREQLTEADLAPVTRQNSLRVHRPARLVSRQVVLDAVDQANEAAVADETEKTNRLLARMEALRRSGQFEYVEPDWIVTVDRTPTDAAYVAGELWGLRNMSAHNAWDVTVGSRQIIVAVIDTGVRYTHRDLAGQMWVNRGEIPGNGRDDDGDGYVDNVYGMNAYDNSGNPWDYEGHGTHVAGTIGAAANGGGRSVGVAWEVQIMACKFLGPDGGATSDAIDCIEFAVAQGAKVLNNSWGGGGFSQSLYNTIAAAGRAGVLFVAAAGNDGLNTDLYPNYPSCYALDNIISVGAIDKQNSPADFSNYGARTVDVFAPGVSIYSCWNTSDTAYNTIDGTSMATPHVSGIAVLALSKYAGITVAELKQLLLKATYRDSSLDGMCVTGGRSDALLSVWWGRPPSVGPANDHFVNARVLSGFTGLVTATNTMATRETGEPYHWETTGGKSVWFRWTAPTSGQWQFDTAGSSFDTILAAYYGSSVSSLTRVANDDDSLGRQSRIGFYAVAGRTYHIAVDGFETNAGTVTLHWTIPDSLPPRVVVTAPAATSRTLDPAINLAGTASDDWGVARVEYQINEGAWRTATGTTAWAAQVVLVAGTHAIKVRSVDFTGRTSPVISRTVQRIASSRLTVRSTGMGTVTPMTGTQWMEVGKVCSLLATPAPGHLFSHWSGDLASVSSRLTWTIGGQDMVVQANFVPNPFLAVRGSYTGLFYDTNGVTLGTAGSLAAQITERGTYTGTLQLRGQRIPFSGQFSVDGRATNVMMRTGLPALHLRLALDFATNTRLLGQIASDGSYAELTADRAVFDKLMQPCPWAGRYTLAFGNAGQSNAAAAPMGHSVGTVLIDAAGKVTFTGTLADGTPVTQSSVLSREGYWPFYLEMQQGAGTVIGWLHLTTGQNSAVAGLLNWIKSAQAGGLRYQNGFDLQLNATGSRYTAPATGDRVLSMSEGTTLCRGGLLAQSLNLPVTLSSDHRLFGANGDGQVSAKFNPQTGWLQGSILESASGRTLKFFAVALQDRNSAYGSFTDGVVAGSVKIQP